MMQLLRHRMSSKVFVINQWPQVFHELSERAYVATTRHDGDQIPEPWICLITGLPLLSDAFWFHLFSERERCLEIILCALSRIVMAIITTRHNGDQITQPWLSLCFYFHLFSKRKKFIQLLWHFLRSMILTPLKPNV